MPDQFRIRTMSEADLKMALQWAEDEGWNPGLDDLEPFRALDPQGFFLAENEGEPVACISGVRYGENYGFIGFYICRPEYRGKGYGLRIWKHAMDYLGDRTVGLDGVVDQQDNYRKSGFQLAYRNIRQGGIAMTDTPMDARLSPLGQGIFTSIRDYDLAFTPDDRSAFLKEWCAPMCPTRKGFAFVEDSTVTGYGVIRQCGDGFKIGPLFADTPEAADVLFRALAGQAKGQTVYLDTPEPNKTALGLAEKYELCPVFETARMYKGPAPDLSIQRTYGVTTFELG
ncbi:GNAT family N-acetyltransferase [Roseibium sp.]|uniref:GNAT family N-acetyltransferase n=1 Tax=Roseibium sp. TaxID=1936156 RepID=UPI003A97F697